MQNAGMAELGLNWRYAAFDVHPAHLAAAIDGAHRMHFVGLNLTLPHKVMAVALMDVLDESARTWGAVNTILFEGQDVGGEWKPLGEFTEVPETTRTHGFNTDADAVVRSIREDLQVEPADARVLVLGAGGAGRTAVLKLASVGVQQLFLVNRTESKAEELRSEVNRRFSGVAVTVGYPEGSVDLAINATTLGLAPGDPLPFDDRMFCLGQAAAVYDMIYRPAETPLLRQARMSGCRTANGLGMLLYQGAKALELWSGKQAPVEVMRRALEKYIYG